MVTRKALVATHGKLAERAANACFREEQIILANLFRLFLGLPATLVTNFRYLPLRQAVRFPILCSVHAWVRGDGTISISGPVRFGMIRLGFGDVGVIPRRLMLFDVHRSGTVTFLGGCYINYACRIVVRGDLSIGDCFLMQPRSTIVAYKSISIGNGGLVSWDCQIIDTDFHAIVDVASDRIINPDDAIVISDNVWIGTRAIVLKGSFIPHGAIIGAMSVVSGQLSPNAAIFVGAPARSIRSGIRWTP